MHVPKLHVPYLMVVGLFGLARAAEAFLPFASTAGKVVGFVQAVAWITHLRWLHRIFRDGQDCLGEALPMSATRVLAFSLLACVVLPVWSAFALMVLLRITVNAHVDRGDPVPAGLDHRAAEAPGLVVAGVVVVLVSIVVFVQLDNTGFYTNENARELAVVDVFGRGSAWGLAVFELACAGYWLWFAARCVPALYASYGTLLSERREPDGGDGPR